MGWSIGYDTNWRRDVGYGVPATCDHPGCGAAIDRGLAYVCGGEPYGGDFGCGLFFCEDHRRYYNKRQPGITVSVRLCDRCGKRSKAGPFKPTEDVPEWISWKLTDQSWAAWRQDNPDQVTALAARLVAVKAYALADLKVAEDLSARLARRP